MCAAYEDAAAGPAPRCPRDRVEAKALELLSARAYPPPSALELLAAFRVLDKAGSGVVGVDKLRRALTNPGTPGALSVGEFDALLAQLPAAEVEGEGQAPRRYEGYARGLL